MGSPKKRIQYRYDSVGNRVGMTDPDGGRFTYSYDAVNRITQVINPQGDRTSYAYDGAGRRIVKKLANGTRASFSYDAASNLTRLANLKSDGTTISSFNYDYDRVGNRTAVLEADGSRVTWSYDDTYQLTGEHRTGTTPYEDTYSYDAAGNRLLKIHDGARTTYSYDAANQLEWSEDASGRTTYTFDADGNQQLAVEPIGDRTTTSWDYENRTTLVQLPSGIRNTMTYEPGGLRVKLEESTGTKKFVWDEQNYLAETDENDDTQVVYTNEPRVYGDLVSQRRATDSHWYHFDAIGSTRELTDSAETVTDTRLYDAWGMVLHSTGESKVSFRFVGKLGYYFDASTHVYYVRRRRYSFILSRWNSADPLWAASGSRYGYSSANPLTRVDPSGLLCAARKCNGGTIDITVDGPARIDGLFPKYPYPPGNTLQWERYGAQVFVSCEFDKPDCDCCEYRQCVKGGHGIYRPPNDGGFYPMTTPLVIDMTDEGYGRRDSRPSIPPDELYDPSDDCLHTAIDLPGFKNVERAREPGGKTLLDLTDAACGLFPGETHIEFYQSGVFTSYIVDVCGDDDEVVVGPEVWGYLVSIRVACDHSSVEYDFAGIDSVDASRSGVSRAGKSFSEVCK